MFKGQVFKGKVFKGQVFKARRSVSERNDTATSTGSILVVCFWFFQPRRTQPRNKYSGGARKADASVCGGNSNLEPALEREPVFGTSGAI